MNLKLFRKAPLGACVCLFSFSAAASDISLYDADGGALTLKTEELRGCALMFDAAGAPFEICRMEAVRIAPEATPRRRPGATEASADAETSDVVYRRIDE